MGRSLHKTEASRGQVLLLAVLVMIAILLTGTLFVAVVNYSQRSSTSHSDRIKAAHLAQGGIEYANYMLQYSALGLDWRPPDPPPASSAALPPPADPFWGPDGSSTLTMTITPPANLTRAGIRCSMTSAAPTNWSGAATPATLTR